jgi:alpha-1,6-mannosyltransferase
MIFIDISTFYYASDGGVKTFYDAKIRWFKKHPEHRYFLVFPGPRLKVEQLAPNIHKVQVYGKKGIIGKTRLLMVDYGKVLKLIRRVKPDVIEVGDFLLTPFFAWFLQRLGLFKGILCRFHHSDPLNTYLYPWAYHPRSNWFKRFTARLGTGLYIYSHRRIPYSMVASQSLKQRLEKFGLARIEVKPFGVQDLFIKNARIRSGGEKRLLFAGRLEHEKGIYLLKQVIPRLLEIPGVQVTVMGKGTHEGFFKHYDHPSLHYLGYVEDREKVETIYRQNTVFLAPGPFETFGIGVLEAISNGMIVVGPDHGGTGEILASMNSPFIFAAHNADAFYQAIRNALDSDLPTESRRSLKKAGDFTTWDRAIEKMIDYYTGKAAPLPTVKKRLNEQESPDFTA